MNLTQKTTYTAAGFFIILLLTVRPADAMVMPLRAGAIATTGGYKTGTAATYTVEHGATSPIIRQAMPFSVVTAQGNTTINAANDFSYALGASSPTGQLLRAGLGVGSVASAAFANPAVGAGLALLSLGVTGYDYYQALKQKGLVFNPSTGAPQYTNPALPSEYGQFCQFGTGVCAATKAAFITAAFPTHPTWTLVQIPVSDPNCYASAYGAIPACYNVVDPVAGRQANAYAPVGQVLQPPAPVTPTNTVVGGILDTMPNAAAEDGINWHLKRDPTLDPIVYLPSAQLSNPSPPYNWTSPPQIISTTNNPDGTVSTTERRSEVTVTPPVNAGAPWGVEEKQVDTTTVTNPANPTAPPVVTTTVTGTPINPNTATTPAATDAGLQTIADALGAGTTVNGTQQNTDKQSAIDSFNTSLTSALHTADIGQQADEDSLVNLFSVNVSAQACTPFTRSILARPVSIDICTYTEKMRELLGWLFAFLSMYTIWHNIFKPRS